MGCAVGASLVVPDSNLLRLARLILMSLSDLGMFGLSSGTCGIGEE